MRSLKGKRGLLFLGPLGQMANVSMFCGITVTPKGEGSSLRFRRSFLFLDVLNVTGRRDLVEGITR